MGQLRKALEGMKIPREADSLVSKADALLDGEAKQAQYIEHLEAEIARLRKEKGISGARDGLTFNDRTGTYVEATSDKHHCTKCLEDEKRVPLKTEDRGWRCMVCRTFFPNPDRPAPVVNTRGPRGGGGSWMGS